MWLSLFCRYTRNERRSESLAVNTVHSASRCYRCHAIFVCIFEPVRPHFLNILVLRSCMIAVSFFLGWVWKFRDHTDKPTHADCHVMTFRHFLTSSTPSLRRRGRARLYSGTFLAREHFGRIPRPDATNDSYRVQVCWVKVQRLNY